MIGQMLAHYRIDAKLGEGGMGVVYKARDTHLDRPVAIKVLPSARVEDPERKRRFVQEAKAASALNHPNIVHIYGVDTASGVDFIAMEYVEGKTLDELVRAKGMRLAQVLQYAVQIADALAQAHAAGILHRDLKPSNIMVTHDGRVKVLDFGLAKLLEPADSSPEGVTLTARTFTEEGAVLGTAPYMSPEQAEGRKLDARSDIFSFGSVLYEMASGRRPFTGDSRLSILARVVNEDPPPPMQFSGAIPPELERIILRCLRKDPARRYQSMADLKVVLEDVGSEPGAGGRVQQTRSWRRWGWVALLPLLLVAGFLALRARHEPKNAEPLRAVPLTSLPGRARYPSFSPDGNHVAFTWNGPHQDKTDIYVQQIGSGSPLRLTKDAHNDYSPVWSPDGRWIGFLRDQSAGRYELRLIPPLGGAERKLSEIRPPGGLLRSVSLAWCPDSTCMVVTDSAGEGKPYALFVVSLESGEKRRLTDPPQQPVMADTEPAVSPDGSWLVFRRNAGPFIGELYRVPLGRGFLATGEPRRLTLAALDANNPTWMPDSKEILFSARGSLWRLAVPGGGTPVRLPFVGEDGLMPVVSRPQPGRPPRLAYVRSYADYNIWRVQTSAPGNTASSPPVVAISSTRWDGTPQFSPDGRRVAFASSRSGEAEIWIADPDGSNAVQLTSVGAVPGFPRWSPDGELIAFHSNPEGQAEVYVIPAAGGKPRNLTSHPAADAFPRFSPDGGWIYFSSNRTGGDSAIWKIPSRGGEAVRVTNSVGLEPFVSPDGASLYYVENVDRLSPLWRLPLAGGVAVKVLEEVVMGNFTVLEGGIYYIDGPSGNVRLQYFDFATRRSRTVAGNLGKVTVGLTASPDGRTILYPRMDSSVEDLMLVENFR